MKVIIFTEGGKLTGLGHISRCISLYDELYIRGIEVEFIINSDIDLSEILHERKYFVVNWRSINYLKSIVDSEHYYIIDSYLATESLYQFIADNSKQVLYLDDTMRINYPKGIIVHPSLNPSKNNDLILFGNDYVILRETFKNSFYKRTMNEVKSVLLTVGGTVQYELVKTILKQVCARYDHITFHVVVGKSLDSFRENEWNNLPKIIFYGYLTSEEMKELMLKSDFAITAAGQTIYELIATATPFIPIQIARNQENNMLAMKSRELITSSIKWKESEFEQKIINDFSNMLNSNFRSRFVEKLTQIVDGMGPERIIDKFLQSNHLHKTEEFYYLRKANVEDSYSVFQLSNEDYVRRYSINDKLIVWDSHQVWFEQVLMAEKYLFLIVTDSSNEVFGQIRYEVTGAIATISISLSRALLGKGLSKKLVRQSINFLRRKYVHVEQIVAFISKENLASKKTFENLGFEQLHVKKEQKNLLKYIYKVE